MPATQEPPCFFISYSHHDRRWLEWVVPHLRFLETEGVLDYWEDRKIVAGAPWREEIDAALERTNVAVLLVSRFFLASPFIRDVEVQGILAKRKADGVRILPIIVSPCPWKKIKWLSEIQVVPSWGKSLEELPVWRRNRIMSDTIDALFP